MVLLDDSDTIVALLRLACPRIELVRVTTPAEAYEAADGAALIIIDAVIDDSGDTSHVRSFEQYGERAIVLSNIPRNRLDCGSLRYFRKGDLEKAVEFINAHAQEAKRCSD